MDLRLSPRRALTAAALALALWVLHDFLPALLSAAVIAVASWPLYQRFAARVPRRLGREAPPLLFTVAITVFVLAPLALALAALLGEANALLRDVAEADRSGIAVPAWLGDLPVLGAWLADRWQADLGHPRGLLAIVQRADPASLLGWAQALGRFTLRQALVIGFAVLLLHWMYAQGHALAAAVRRWSTRAMGRQGVRYLDLATRGVRASVHSMLAVALFDGLAAAAAYAVIWTPRALVWAAITGLLASVPFLGYAAVGALVLRLVTSGLAGAALACAMAGSLVLLVGDKVVRPAVTRSGLRLPFAFVLVGCVGGFETLGLVGLVLGPVVLSVAAEALQQRGRARAR